jgi:tetratricopeptide (TPR) repeat protein
MNNTSVKEIFDPVHTLIRDKRLSIALRTLIEYKTGKLRQPFSKYSNHAWYLVGDIYLKMANFDKAAIAFKKSMHHDIRDKDALLALGYCYSESKHPVKAKNILERGRLLFPRDARIKYNLANAYFDLNNFEAAKRLYRALQKCGDLFIAKASKKNLATMQRILDEDYS